VVPPVAAPTYAPDLAGGILALLARGATGCFHVTNDGECSRFELARAIVAAAGRADAVRVEPREPEGQGLARPQYSVLDNRKFESVVAFRLRAWQAAVREHVGRRP
jgi:dTDP-4-dehydrorhamnose reductase